MNGPVAALPRAIRIGIIDSGIQGAACPAVVARQDFRRPEAPARSRAKSESSAHGNSIAEILLSQAPGCELLDARVFGATLRCSATRVALAMRWLLAQQIDMVNMSFGLREDRAVLREACARALREGVILLAAAPARGEPVFPGAYPGVIRATGDARCAAGEISHLATSQADFGGHVRCLDGTPGGASMGCAFVCAAAARVLHQHPGIDGSELCRLLAASARYRGPERRG